MDIYIFISIYLHTHIHTHTHTQREQATGTDHLLGENQTKEDVLQVDEEVQRIDGPILPGTETSHHPLLQDNGKPICHT